ncbi:MAG: hypothetical protein KIT17_10935 [Rubrivivax sp.]|nr:hypothetical protein [Rubrivivax sp.]
MNAPVKASAPAPARRLPRILRRARCEAAATGLVALGLVMLMQPWSLALYTHSFVVLLAGVLGLSVAVKLPE